MIGCGISLLVIYLNVPFSTVSAELAVNGRIGFELTEPEIRLGYRKFHWDDAFRALKKLNDLLLKPWGPDPYQIDLIAKCDDRFERLTGFQRLRLPSKKHSLHDRLQGTQFLQALDARDKVYGILGITSLSKDVLVSDYTLSVQTTLTPAVITMLKSGDAQLYQNFPLYCTAYEDPVDSEIIPAWPSWVPNLSLLSKMSDSYNDWKSHYWDPDNILEYDDSPILSRPRSIADHGVRSDKDTRTLHVAGRMLGSLSWCSTPQSFRGHGKAQRLYDLFRAAEANGSQPNTFEKVAAQRGQKEHPRPNSGSKEEYERRLRRTLTPESGVSSKLRQDMYQATRYQTLFTTASSHCGKSYHPDPGGVRAGDALVGLFGVDFPFLLRPIEDGKYGMINVAYLADHRWSIEGDDKVLQSRRIGLTSRIWAYKCLRSCRLASGRKWRAVVLSGQLAGH